MAYRQLPPEPVGLPEVEPLVVGEARQPPEDAAWLHEIKQDGWRLLVYVDGKGGLRCKTRSGRDYTWQFGAIARELARCGHAVVLDGEVAIANPDGVTNLDKLHKAMRAQTSEGMRYYAFDMLWFDGRDLRPLPLEKRKEMLHQLCATEPTGVLYVDHVVGQGAKVFASAKQLGVEGIVSKRLGSAYVGGSKPSSLWLKSICNPPAAS
jgi:bifunctional non-homologous end joining protein LigD